MCFVFFFKQKTAYEMRISDWSSDVCSSDLTMLGGEGKVRLHREIGVDQVGFAVEQDALGRLVDLGDRAEQRQAKLALGFCRIGDAFVDRSEERRGGKEFVSTCRSRWSPDH